MPGEPALPFRPDAGVQDLLQGTAAGGVGEDDGTKGGAIHLAGGIEDRRAELRAEGGAGGGVGFEQAAGAGVGVKGERAGPRREEAGEGGFAGGDAAGDGEGRHGKKG